MNNRRRIIDSELPHAPTEVARVPNRYAGSTLDHVHKAPEPPKSYALLDGDNEFEELTQLALRNQREILQLALDRDDADFAVILRAKAAVCAGILSATIRVDEGRLKKRTTDGLAQLLDVLDKEHRKLVTLEGEFKRMN